LTDGQGEGKKKKGGRKRTHILLVRENVERKKGEKKGGKSRHCATALKRKRKRGRSIFASRSNVRIKEERKKKKGGMKEKKKRRKGKKGKRVISSSIIV